MTDAVSDDVLRRLRAADPCVGDVSAGGVSTSDTGRPAGSSSAMQVRIDAIVDADPARVRTGSVALVELEPWVLPAPRRSRAAAIVMVAAVVAALVVGVVAVVRAGSSPPPRPTAEGVAWQQFTGAGVTFEHPAAWGSYPYPLVGEGTVVLTYLSTATVTPPCVPFGLGKAVPSECFDPTPSLAGGGVFVTWAFETLGHAVQDTTGSDTTLGGRTARVDESSGAGWCPGTGAARSVRASIALPEAGQLLLVTACAGPGDVDGELSDVDRMLASVRIER